MLFRLLRHRWSPFLLLCLVGMTVFAAPIDPDLGWHWRIGQQIWAGQFPYADNLTFSMPGYAWVHHEWLTDIGLYAAERLVGWLPLAFLFTLIFVLAFRVAAQIQILPVTATKKSWPKNALQLSGIACLGVIVSSSVVGIRPQVITLFAFAGVLALLWRVIRGDEHRLWLLPFIMMLWANLHGGFPIGFVLIFAYGMGLLIPGFNQLANSAATGRQILKYGSIALLATLVNPYGYRLWWETIQTSTDAFAKRNIEEWLPISANHTLFVPILVYVAGIGLALWFLRHRLPRIYWIPLPLLLFLGYSSIRHWPFVVLYTLPLAMPLLKLAQQRIPANFVRHWVTFWQVWLGRLIALTLGLALVLLPATQAADRIPASIQTERLTTRSGYPESALPRLRATPEANLFNLYGWGGYLAWQLPERHYFIDGRMASWKTPERHILFDYDKLVGAKDNWQSLLNMYRINQVLLPPDRPLVDALKQQAEWTITFETPEVIILERQL